MEAECFKMKSTVRSVSIESADELNSNNWFGNLEVIGDQVEAVSGK